jgi:hypothetical protein
MITKRGRGKGKKLAMAYVNLRLSIPALEYYQQFPAYTTEMRKVLEEHAQTKKEVKPA